MVNTRSSKVEKEMDTSGPPAWFLKMKENEEKRRQEEKENEEKRRQEGKENEEKRRQEEKENEEKRRQEEKENEEKRRQEEKEEDKKLRKEEEERRRQAEVEIMNSLSQIHEHFQLELLMSNPNKQPFPLPSLIQA
ncbi:uncharacterized protein LOC126878824 [Diabrotica virgifera virgifera]|uniref:Uncharacterized protein n=1 Tax=Diabrotica virgifera virgifera TaxID=50390 RepID=A0ABM5JIC4_DIAVI|nr:uncharacterized protein LOC126878824 [Diabrotica virgifera virgifera]